MATAPAVDRDGALGTKQTHTNLSLTIRTLLAGSARGRKLNSNKKA